MSEALNKGEELDVIWEGDLLDRRKDADFLQKFLIAKSNAKADDPDSPSYVLNIDQPWGEGKTFFLTRFEQQLATEKHLTCYINAWEDDFSDDPMIPIISALDKKLEEVMTSSGKRSTALNKARKSMTEAVGIIGKHLLVGVLKKATGVGLSELSDDLTSDDDTTPEVAKDGEIVAEKSANEILSNFRAGKKHANDFKEAFSAVIRELAKSEYLSPVFILIDELDRCKPTYAIALLERMKHLFSVPGAVFVLATDRQQLSHSICAVYGNNFDGTRYLNRFFNRTYSFPDPTREKYIHMLIITQKIDLEKTNAPFQHDKLQFIEQCANFYELSLRDIAQTMDMFLTVTEQWEYKSPIELVYLLPLIFSLYKNRKQEFDALSDFNAGEWKNSTNKNNKNNFIILKNNYDDKKDITFENCFVEFMNYPKNDILSRPSVSKNSGQIHLWLNTVFSSEFSLEHGNRASPGQKIKSIVTQYPDYVRYARQITK
ncbi:MAG: P-loop NTPase fold protein [Pseudomonadota bacterium]